MGWGRGGGVSSVTPRASSELIKTWLKSKSECFAFAAGCDKTRKCTPSAYTNTSRLRKMPLHLPQESTEFIHVAHDTHMLPTEK